MMLSTCALLLSPVIVRSGGRISRLVLEGATQPTDDHTTRLIIRGLSEFVLEVEDELLEIIVPVRPSGQKWINAAEPLLRISQLHLASPGEMRCPGSTGSSGLRGGRRRDDA